MKPRKLTAAKTYAACDDTVVFATRHAALEEVADWARQTSGISSSIEMWDETMDPANGMRRPIIDAIRGLGP